jgi:hypothetical protein
MVQLVSMLLLLLVPVPNIVVHVQAENGAAIVNQPIAFRQEGGGLVGNCVSDQNGRCEITLTGDVAEGEMIRGVLDLGASGVRSLIWMPPEAPEVFIVLDEFGKVNIPGHELHPTPETFSEVSPTALPLVENEPTAVPLATTEYVVVDPSISDPTSSPVVERETAVIETFPLEQEPSEAGEAVTSEKKRPLGWIITLNTLFIALWIGGIVYLWRKKNA